MTALAPRPPSEKRPRTLSSPQQELIWQCKVAKLPRPEVEWRFHSTRLWRFDLAWPSTTSFAVEIDGGGFVNGRHSRGKGMEGDCEKYAEAMLAGWRVLRVTPKHITSGEALAWIQKLLA